MIEWSKLFKRRSPVCDLTPDEISASEQAGRVVDVREPHEFHGDMGHLPSAELAPLGSLTAIAAEWSPDEPLLVYCRSGMRSSLAARRLRRAGFAQVCNLSGGIMAWRERGLPVHFTQAS